MTKKRKKVNLHNVLLQSITTLSMIGIVASVFLKDWYPRKASVLCLLSVLWLVIFTTANGLYTEDYEDYEDDDE